MGQRHQIFIISQLAKNGRYRCLAAVHHQWLYGQSAIAVCQRLIKIFQEPRNHALLAHEKQLAAAHDASSEQDTSPWNTRGSGDEVPPFPFIATCLNLGASLDPQTGFGSTVHNLPVDMSYDGGDNNDGITVLDITDPNRVRYAFVVLGMSETRNFANTPLTGWEYAASYDKDSFKGKGEGEDEDEDDELHRLWSLLQGRKVIGNEELISAPLIDTAALESAWPAGAWVGRAERKLPPVAAAPAAVPGTHLVDGEARVVPTPAPDNDALRVVHEAFVRSYRLLDPCYEEEQPAATAATTAGNPTKTPRIKQIVHIASLDYASTSKIAASEAARNPFQLSFNKDALKIWTFPVDDLTPTLLTAGVTLEVVHSWLRWTAARDKVRDWLDYEGMCSKPQTMVKAFSLPNPEIPKVKPWPAKAFVSAKLHSACSATYMESAIEAIKPGEWTILVWRDSPSPFVECGPGSSTATFKIGFITRDDNANDAGDKLIIANAAEFRRLLSSTADYAAAVALDAGEEEYGKALVDLLARAEKSERKVGGVQVSVYDTTEEVREVLDLVRRFGEEQARDVGNRQTRDMWMAHCKKQAMESRARAREPKVRAVLDSVVTME